MDRPYFLGARIWIRVLPSCGEIFSQCAVVRHTVAGRGERGFYALPDGNFADVETGVVFAHDDENCVHPLGNNPGACLFNLTVTAARPPLLSSPLCPCLLADRPCLCGR